MTSPAFSITTRSEEHTSELQSRQYLPSFPPRRSSDLIVCEPAPQTCRAGGILAPPHHLLFVAVQLTPARAAGGWHHPGCRTGRTQAWNRCDYPRNDVSGLLDHHQIGRAHV